MQIEDVGNIPCPHWAHHKEPIMPLVVLCKLGTYGRIRLARHQARREVRQSRKGISMGITSEYLDLKERNLLSGLDLRLKITRFFRVPNVNPMNEQEVVYGEVVGDHPELKLSDRSQIMIRLDPPRDGNRLIEDLRKGSHDYGDGVLPPHEAGDEVVFLNVRPVEYKEESGTIESFAYMRTTVHTTRRDQFLATDFQTTKELTLDSQPTM